MAQDIARLEDALRKAAETGDTEAATRFATEIRNRRASEGQPSPVSTPLEQGPQEVDPLADVPTEIGGVVLSDNIRNSILEGRNIEDPKERRMAAARIAGRLAAEDESGTFADQVARGQFGAGLRGFGAGIFGLGDVAAAAGTTIAGQFSDAEEPLSFGEALEAQREFRRALEGEFPLTAGAAELAGAVTGGGVALKAAKRISGVGQLTTLRKGETLANIGKVSALGAAGGAITEGITEGDPLGGAILGAAAGPLGVAIAKAASITASGVKSLLETPAGKGLRALAKQMGESAEEMSRRFLEFEAVTGTKPAIADIANPQAVAELRNIISERTSAVAIAREGAEEIVERRGPEIAEQITGGRVTTTQAAQQAKRTAVAERQFALADKDPIEFTGEQVQDLLADPDLRAGIPRTLRRRIDEVLSETPEGEAVTLTGLDVNDLRKALRQRGRGATGADRVFLELADEIENVGREQSPRFAQAIEEFAARSRRGEGVTAGRRVRAADTSEFEEVVTQATDPDLAAGVRVGARSALEDAATEGAAPAARLIDALTGDTGLTRRLKAALSPEEFAKIQNVARVQGRSIRNTGQLAPGVRADADGSIQAAVQDAVGALVVAGGNTGGAFKASIIQRALGRLVPSLSEDVVNNIARDAFNPAKTQAVIKAMRRAELSDEQILNIYATVATASGIEAAETF